MEDEANKTNLPGPNVTDSQRKKEKTKTKKKKSKAIDSVNVIENSKKIMEIKADMQNLSGEVGCSKDTQYVGAASSSSDVPLEIILEKSYKSIKIYRAVVEPGSRVLEAIFRTMYCHPDMGSDKGNSSLKEWFQNLKLNQKKVKYLLGRNYWNKEDCKPLEKEFDIQFYLVAIEMINPILFERYFNDAAHAEFCEIKSMRNKLAHIRIHENNLSELKSLNALQGIYISLLNYVGNEFNERKYTDKVLYDLRKQMNKIRNKDIDINESMKNMSNFVNENVHLTLIKDCQTVLNDMHVDGKSRNPFFWMYERTFSEKLCFDLNKVFTLPWLECSGQKLNTQELLAARTSEGHDARLVLVSGYGGSGKTILCHKLFSEWQNKPKDLFNNLDSFDLVFMIDMRCCKKNSLESYLRHTINTLNDKKYKDCLLEIMAEISILFIIDGFDEKGEDSTKLIKDIAKKIHNKLAKSKIILTTRAEFSSEAKHIFSNCTILDVILKGFDIVGRNLFSQKLFYVSGNQQHFVKFKVFLESRGNILDEHLKYPLTIALLILLFLNDVEESSSDCVNYPCEHITSGTQLYTELIDMLESKLLNVRRKTSHANGNKVRTLLLLLSEKALNQLSSNELELILTPSNYEKIKVISKEYDVDVTEFLSAFMEYELDKKDLFKYIHKTEMDFLSALYIAKKVEMPGSDIITYFDSDDKRKYVEVLPFLTGCLSKNNKIDSHASSILDVTKSADINYKNFGYFFKLVSEMEGTNKTSHKIENLHCSSKLCLELPNYLPLGEWNLNVDTVIPGLRLLCHLKEVEIHTLELDFDIHVDIEKDERTKELEDLFKTLHFAFKRQKRFTRNKIQLSLHLHPHYFMQKNIKTFKNKQKNTVVSNNTLSDGYLKYLNSWANLVKFTGHIGSIESLFSFTKLKSLSIVISSPEVFNNFITKCYPRYNKLKNLHLSFNFPPNTEMSTIMPIPAGLPLPDIRLVFHAISPESFEQQLQVVQRISQM